MTLHWLGASIDSQARYVDSEGIFKETLAGRRRVLGNQHKDTLDTLYWLGLSIYHQNRCVDAKIIQQELVGLARRVYGDQDKFTLNALKALSETESHVKWHWV